MIQINPIPNVRIKNLNFIDSNSILDIRAFFPPFYKPISKTYKAINKVFCNVPEPRTSHKTNNQKPEVPLWREPPEPLMSTLNVSRMPNVDALPALKLASSISQTETKVVWIWTRNREVMQAAVEAGWSTFMFSRADRELAMNWASITMIEPMFIEGSFVYDVDGSLVACMETVGSGTDLIELTQLAGQTHTVIMNTTDWMSIPAENVVAAFQKTKTPVLGLTSTCNESRVMLEALERGTNGVVLRTDNPQELFFLKNYLDSQTHEKKMNDVTLSPAKIVRIQPAGMGERVCVDLCCLLKPGEGLLVGSFARTLFLVHSECLESDYISSRPFRVNAGPVHAYVGLPGGKTAYLSELRSGSEIMVVDANGNSHSAVIGRVKIELRPLILIEAEIESHGEYRHSLLLQNAETVRLVVPDDCPSGGRAVSVSELSMGDHVLVAVQDSAARHAGSVITEQILER